MHFIEKFLEFLKFIFKDMNGMDNVFHILNKFLFVDGLSSVLWDINVKLKIKERNSMTMFEYLHQFT